MLTKVGKRLRQIRLERAEYLKDMAHNIGVTSSYLSSVENGKRDLTNKLVDKISESYNLSEKMKHELQSLAMQARQKIEVDVNNESDARQDAALAFARKFKSLDEDQINRIKEILEGENVD